MEDRHPKRHPGRDGGQEVADPIRTCIGCRTRRPQSELVRITTWNGALNVFVQRRDPGRGAYVCPLAECEKLALQKDRLARALRHKFDAPALDELAQKLARRRGE